MAKLSSLKAAFRRKKGFSLAVVMLISFVGLVIVGAILQFAVSSSGGGRVNIATAEKYNLLQSALEDGKARLKESMNNKELPPKYTDKYDGNVPENITSPETLLLPPQLDDGLELGEKIVMSWNNRAEMERIGIFGDSGELTVKIYDMQYDAAQVNITNPEDLQLLPPAMPQLPLNVTENNASAGGLEMTKAPDSVSGGSGGGTGNPDEGDKGGVYLIRAALTVKDAAGTPIHTWSLETSVIQYNNNI